MKKRSVFPSSACAVVRAQFPTIAATFDQETSSTYPRGADNIGIGRAMQLASVIAVVDAIPDALLPASADRYAQLTTIVARMRFVQESWAGVDQRSSSGATLPQRDLFELLEILSELSDEEEPPSTEALGFIDDSAFEREMLIDQMAAIRSLDVGLFKSATVLAASFVEAALLYMIQRLDADELELVKGRVATHKKLSDLKNPPLKWHLESYLEVALEATIISKAARDQGMLCKDFRNLVHPGRAVSLNQRCDRGTAHAALAAMYLITEECRATANRARVVAEAELAVK